MKKNTKVVFILGLILSSLFLRAQQNVVYSEGNSDTCPEGSGWVKVDNLSGLTYTYSVPEGNVVTSSCYKASTQVVYGTSATVTSTVFNSPGGVTCTDVGVPDNGCSLQELSHASFLLDPVQDSSSILIEEIEPTITPEPTTEPTVTPEPTTEPSSNNSTSNSDNILASSNQSNQNDQPQTGQVLGASTSYAATGGSSDLLMMAMTSISLIASGVSYKFWKKA